ncbi:peptide ABC transporter substrate-binding protein [Virgibacillus sp. MSJ-26]|uniref:peptide ABC transporter substrate-binding protein n=1 Tax=Virgibacillus sp. MSJ-26 TaxID=2841522 RepID=UPI001C126C16|nr:peptide ABC transporter substrate-binding protein [Virgibacillus sp. MSJ-26]MBU5465793.1 peptide ABC transporter substrate-binding protein [Virgibacillus sp. MSJ-26]
MKKLSRIMLLVLFSILIGTALAGCSSSSGGDKEVSSADNETDTEQEINLISNDSIPTMDPHMGTDVISFEFIGASNEGLYRLGDDLEIEPGMAMDHDVSEDGLTWTFNLREDAKWANGDPVTANDFVYAWRRAVNPDTGSEYGPYLMDGVIKNATAVSNGEKSVDELGVEADGDHTLVVTLEKPTPYFESLTTRSTFMPLNREFVEEQGDDFATSDDNLLSNGPFLMTNWESTSDSWTLEKNPDYWDEEAVSLEKINFNVIKDPQTGVDLYESGEVDRTDLTSDFVDQYSVQDDFVVTPETSLYYLKLNQTESEALANVNIRKALSKAIDKQALVDELLNDGSLESNGFVPQDFAKQPETEEDFRDINGDLLTFDTEEAQELWEKGLEEIDEKELELEILSGDTETSKTLGEYLANQMETNLPGLSVSLKQVPFEQRIDLDNNMDYQIQIAGWGPSYLDLYTWMDLWLTDGQNNKMGYSNEEYDELVKSTVDELALDPEKRFDAFLEAEKILAEDVPVVPLYQNGRSQLIDPKIDGIISRPFGPKYEYKWAEVVPTE